MAGTAHGRHSIRTTTPVQQDKSNELYVSCFKGLEALDTLGVVNRVAYYFGDGGTGTDFHDGANPTTTNAFSVWEFPPAGSRTWSWYFILQYSEGTPFGGAGNGAPGRIDGSTTGTYLNLGFQVAVAFTSGGASANPWTAAGGTTNNDGTDSKADPVWDAPVGGSLQVYPKNNNTGETYATSKENCAFVSNINSNITTRLHMIADNDNIMFAVDHDDNGEYDNILACGWYTLLSGLTTPGPLFLMRDSTGNLRRQITYTDDDGGIVAPLDGSIRELRFDTRDNDMSTIYQPNNQFSSPEYMETPLALYVQDVSPGLVGFADTAFFRQSYGMVTNSTLDSLDRVAIGPTTSTEHTTVPWDGVTTDPGNPATTRVGIDF